MTLKTKPNSLFDRENKRKGERDFIPIVEALPANEPPENI